MKKFLLSLVCAFTVAGIVKAETVEFDFSGGYQSYMKEGLAPSTNTESLPEGEIAEISPISLSVTTLGQNGVRWWAASNNNELRVYTGSVMTISCESGYAITDVTPSAGSAVKVSDTSWTISGPASKNTAIKTISVTYTTDTTGEGGGTTDPDPDQPDQPVDPTPGGDEDGATITITTADTKAANNSSSYVTDPFDVTASGYTFVFDEVNPSNGQMRVNQVGLGGFNLHNSTAMPSVKKIVITADQGTLGTWYMAVNNTEAITVAATVEDIAGVVDADSKTVTFTVPEDQEVSYFMVNLTAKGSGTVKFTSIEIVCGEGGGTTDPDPDQPDQPVDPTPGDVKSHNFIWKDMGYANAADITSVTEDGITLTFEKGDNSNGTKYYTSGDAIRMYASNTLTVSVPAGNYISDIVFATASGYPFLENSSATIGEFNADAATWTSSSKDVTTVTFNNGTGNSGQARFTSIYVYVNGDKVEQGGGSEGPEAPVGTITVEECIALVNAGYSGAATVKGIVSQVDKYNADYSSITYWISDDGTTANQMMVYSGLGLNKAKFTSVDEVEVGAAVEVTGNVKEYNSTVEFDYNNYMLSYTAPAGGGTETPEPEEPGELEGATVTFNFTDPASLGINVGDATEYDLTNETLTKSPIEMLCEGEGASTPIRLYSSNGNWTFRFYNATSFTITSSEGYYLTGIEFDGTNLGTDWTISTGSLNGNVWTPAKDKVTTNVEFGKNKTGNNPTIKTMTVYYLGDETTGVEGIGAEEGEAVYFNLQGVRVANPEHGIFVKVQNGKAVKVVK